MIHPCSATCPQGVSAEDLDIAGRRYQSIFRILDLISLQPEETVEARLAALTDAEIREILAIHYPGLGASEGRKLVAAFLAEDAGLRSSSDPIRAVMAYKRRGLLDFAEKIHLFSAENRRRRMNPRRSAGDPLAFAMSVTPLASGWATGPIIRAAILYRGFVWSKAAPKRHSDIINEMFPILGENIDAPQTEGFLSASGHFLGRREALALARACNQDFIEEPVSDELFSENLW